MNDPSDLDLEALSAQERAFVTSIADDERRNVVACSLVAHRRPDRLTVGDPVPALELPRLEGGASVELGGFAGDRPLVLVFGSFT